MEYNSVVFISIFFPVVLFLVGIFPKFAMLIILLSSSVFYLWNSTTGFIFLFFSVLIVNFVRKKKWLLKRSEVVAKFLASLLVLSPFLFFRTSQQILELFPSLQDIASIYPEALILPAGVSFYSFQLLGYLFDNEPSRDQTSLKKDFSFILFFPQLIAGPIERARDLIPQISKKLNSFSFDKNNIKRGFYLFSIGLFIKTFFADFLAATIQIGYYETGFLGSLETILANGCVIYFDFLGYSLIAIGLASFFNIELTLNFRRPYAALNPQEFWRRWHITLTNWFKDYLYKPINEYFKYSNVGIILSTTLVFIITSLWHGFGTRFIIWGFGHLCLVLLSRYLNKYKLFDNQNKKYYLFINWIFTYLSVNILWLFFFYETPKAILILKNLFKPQIIESHHETLFIIVIFLATFSILFNPYLLTLKQDKIEILNQNKFNSYKNRFEDYKFDSKNTLFNDFSIYFTIYFYKFTKSTIFLTFLLFVSIAFFSYSKTFIYFRF